MKRLLIAAALALLTTTAYAGTGIILTCEIHAPNPNDPTANARTRPNGVILNVFVNHETVRTYDNLGDWIYVDSANDKVIGKYGWVHKSYLRNCHSFYGDNPK
jgi:hypothetical protein